MAALIISAMFHVFKTVPECAIHFNVHRVRSRSCGIRVKDNPNFARVDVMVEINNSETAVIGKESESAIELDSRQLGAMAYIDCVIKEDGTTGREVSRATHRSAPSVSMMAGSKLLQDPLTMM